MVNSPDLEETLHAAGMVGGIDTTINDTTVSELVNSACNTNYNIGDIMRLEKELGNIELALPAKKSPDIQTILKVIEQIVGGTSLKEVHQYLEDTQNNSSTSRNDVQRCGSLLHKISGLQSSQGLNWKSIFIRLEL